MITLIAAIGKNNELGEENALLWDLPEDMKHFRTRTKGSAVIMGRKTFESIGFPLPKRNNIIISRDPDYSEEGITSVTSPDESLWAAGDDSFVIGGAQIYRLFLEKATHLSLTFVNAEFPNADAFFPEIDFDLWEEVSRTHNKKDEKHEYDFDIVEYIRK